MISCLQGLRTVAWHAISVEQIIFLQRLFYCSFYFDYNPEYFNPGMIDMDLNINMFHDLIWKTASILFAYVSSKRCH